MKGQFPSLLSEKATLLGSLNREDLALLGLLYLTLSWMKALGIISMLGAFMIVLLVRYSKSKLPNGFFRGLRSKRIIKHSHIKNLKENLNA